MEKLLGKLHFYINSIDHVARDPIILVVAKFYTPSYNDSH